MKNKNQLLRDRSLIRLLQIAYSAERAAAFAYIGHANSLKCIIEKAEIKQIETDEWDHRASVKKIMDLYQIPVSGWYEIKYWIIGKFVGLSCHMIGYFMPFFFAGKLESGNVCAYFEMQRAFMAMDINEHNEVLYEMGIREKEHEVYFLKKVENSKLLRNFERVFNWGKQHSSNDVDLGNKRPVTEGSFYCMKQKPEQNH